MRTDYLKFTVNVAVQVKLQHYWAVKLFGRAGWCTKSVIYGIVGDCLSMHLQAIAVAGLSSSTACASLCLLLPAQLQF